MFRTWDTPLAIKGIKSALKSGLLVCALTLASTGLVQAKGPASETVSGTVALAQLPAQAQDMMKLIYAGGPFKFDKDGTVFGNRERILPAKTRGF